jgi:hypothetical protein
MPNQSTKTFALVNLRFTAWREAGISTCTSAPKTTNLPTMLGNATNGSSSITLPLASVENEVYIAKNQGHSYTLDFDRQRLTVVMPGGKQVTQSIEQVYD